MVTATGMATEVGRISGMLQAQPTVKTPLTRQLDRLSKQLFSIEAKDERQSAFSLGTFSDRTFITTTGLSFFLLVMSTVLRPFQVILKTTTLDVRQWLICTAVALSIIATAEIRKAARRRTAPEVTTAAAGKANRFSW